MTESFDTVFHGGHVFTPAGLVETDLGIRDGRIVALGGLRPSVAERHVDCHGLTILPGVIDTQVHFREPGLEHKEDLASGTLSAVAGGVTSVFEMPNTKPLTTTADRLADKFAAARGRIWCDVAFYVGATAENAAVVDRLERLPGAAGLKIFMGSSTGELLIEDDYTLARVFAKGHRRVAVHAEDEPRLIERFALVAGGAPVTRHPQWRDVETAVKATTRILRIAEEARRPVHVLHVTTEEEMAILARHKDLASVEVTPQHLTLAAPEAYERLGSFAQMNPPIREERHRRALWRAVADGTVDIIGSDHAPHTRDEKAKPYPESPSGMTGVQTLVPVMLTHVAEGRLSLARFVDLTSSAAQRLFGVAGKGRIAHGYDADLTIVDLNARRTIETDWIKSKAGWTPFEGHRVTGWPIMTVVRGRVVMQDDAILGEPAGQPLRFLT